MKPTGRRDGPRSGGFTLVEVAVAVGIFSMVLYIVMTALILAKQYFLAGQLSHALQGAVILGSELEEDLRQAVRDPTNGRALVTGTGTSKYIAFYLALARERERDIVAIPVRWSFVEPAGAQTGYLVRTAYNADKGQWDKRSFAWAPIPTATSPAPDGVNPLGFQVQGDGSGAAGSLVQTILLTVMARDRKLEKTPGAEQDRATLQIAVAIPALSAYLAPLFRPLKRIEELPPET